LGRLKALELTDREIDTILYNLHLWRKAVALMEPKTTSSFIKLPVRNEPSRAVEYIAIKRASISVVLDAVESALQGFPPGLRYIVKLRYEKRMTYRRIAKTLDTTKSSIHRKVDIIRKSFRTSLAQVDVDIRCLLRDKEL